MQRIYSVTHPEGKAKTLLDNARREIGARANFLTAFANAPAALEGFLQTAKPKRL